MKGKALAVPRLFFSPAKAAELSFQADPSVRRYGVWSQALCGVWCLCLVPAYSAGERTEGSPGSLALYSLLRTQQAFRLWLVVPTAYLCNLALCGLLWKEYEHFVKLRRSWLGGDVQDGLQSIDAAIDAAYDAGSRHLQTAARMELRGPRSRFFEPEPGTTAEPDDRTNRVIMLSIQDDGRMMRFGCFAKCWSGSSKDINSIQINWSRGVTPPRLLCGGHEQLAQLYLDNGADLLPNDRGDTPEDLARYNQHYHLLPLLATFST
ncbi:hypothetical protein AK812_SmicGene12304 [Symbiodinium microadriaticum]|uniref:Uncharacterized protein n=1 Tax=Symbiodinium microadriaticum TaxID=2951 RepID=A0A1Q9EB25_SYMMI|nr:hypothetical protein AK812_SmicGene12304 [Symbiodinium microadriaticum]